MRRSATLLVAAVSASVSPVRWGPLGASSAVAQQDWFASIFTPGGVELRADERLFALFALLNGMGHDDAPVVRTFPVEKRKLHPLRARVRDAVASTDPALRAEIDAYFDAHARPVGEYVAYVLQLGPAPEFEPTPGAPKALAGFDVILRKFYKSTGLAKLFVELQEPYREELKKYIAAVDAPLAKARTLLGVAEGGPRPVLCVNLLDGAGNDYGVVVGDELFLVVGGGDAADAETVVRAFARHHASAARKKAKLVRGLEGALVTVRDAPGVQLPEPSPGEYLVSTIARAVAIRATAGTASKPALAKAHKSGYVLVNAVYGLLAEQEKTPKPFAQFAAEQLPKIDATKALAP